MIVTVRNNLKGTNKIKTRSCKMTVIFLCENEVCPIASICGGSAGCQGANPNRATIFECSFMETSSIPRTDKMEILID
jgi:hypothetical protein